MNINRVLLLGGSGFVGTSVAEHLTRAGYFVTVPTRRFDRAKHLTVMPTLEVVTTNVFDTASLDALVKQHDAVINLVGTLHDNFTAVHEAFPRLVAEACARHNVARLIHMSALGANNTAADDRPSHYLCSRSRGEVAVQLVCKAHPGVHVTMFRPSVVFGEHDKFLNLFAGLVRLFPALPLGSADAQFQPVWVEDVARAIVTSIPRAETHGHTYPLVGPHVYTLRELVKYVANVLGKRRLIFGLGAGLSLLQATVFEFLPGKLITRDNVRSMREPNTSDVRFPAFAEHPAAMESIVPAYLGVDTGTGRGRYATLRNRAGRAGQQYDIFKSS
jgi:uncharacterized protein YbjT (DUF2867 family)